MQEVKVCEKVGKGWWAWCPCTWSSYPASRWLGILTLLMPRNHTVESEKQFTQVVIWASHGDHDMGMPLTTQASQQIIIISKNKIYRHSHKQSHLYPETWQWPSFSFLLQCCDQRCAPQPYAPTIQFLKQELKLTKMRFISNYFRGSMGLATPIKQY